MFFDEENNISGKEYQNTVWRSSI